MRRIEQNTEPSLKGLRCALLKEVVAVIFPRRIAL
jgi:hypothetical protein